MSFQKKEEESKELAGPPPRVSAEEADTEELISSLEGSFDTDVEAKITSLDDSDKHSQGSLMNKAIYLNESSLDKLSCTPNDGIDSSHASPAYRNYSVMSSTPHSQSSGSSERQKLSAEDSPEMILKKRKLSEDCAETVVKKRKVDHDCPERIVTKSQLIEDKEMAPRVDDTFVLKPFDTEKVDDTHLAATDSWEQQFYSLRESYISLQRDYEEVQKNSRSKYMNQGEYGKGFRIVKSTFNGILTCFIDEDRKEITSVTLTQNKYSGSKCSSSSGYQADVSFSDASSAWSGPVNSLPLVRFSMPTSTASSSTSSQVSNGLIPIEKISEGSMPSPPSSWSISQYKRARPCICNCFCSSLFTERRSSDLSSSLKSSIISKPEEPVEGIQNDAIVPCGYAENTNSASSHQSNSGLVMEEETNIPDSGAVELKEAESYEEHSEDLSTSKEGLLVFAKWPADQWYYPGIVLNSTLKSWKENTHLMVLFYDNNTQRNIATLNMFPIHLLTTDLKVMCKEKVDYSPFKLVGVKRVTAKKKKTPHPPLSFVVKDSSGEKCFPFKNIAVPDSTYKVLKKEKGDAVITPSLSTKKSHIDPGNLQEGKRKRTPKKLSFPDNSKSLSKIRPLSITPIKEVQEENSLQASNELGKTRDQSQQVATDSKNDSQIRESLTPLEYAIDPAEWLKDDVNESRPGPSNIHMSLTGCSSAQKVKDEAPCFISSSESDLSDTLLTLDCLDEAFDIEYIPPSKTQSKGDSKVKSSLKKKALENDETVKTLGPIPKEPIFSGYCFVITHAKPRAFAVLPISIDYSSSGDLSDVEADLQPTVPFDFLRLKEQVISGSGEWYRYLTDVPQEKLTKTIVITDLPCLTANYVLSVARGVPIYQHDLIVKCCINNKPVQQELAQALRMPRGRSLETGRLVFANKPHPLKDYCCLLALSNKEALPLWKTLVEYSGGKVWSHRTPGGLEGVSFSIADNDIDPTLYHHILQRKIPILSKTWLLQTIIHGSQRLWEKTPQYIVNLA